MHVHAYEKAWAYIIGVVLALFFSAVVYAAYGMGVHLPDDMGQIDPALIEKTAPFDKLGVTQVGPNEYNVVMIAQMFKFYVGQPVADNKPPALSVPAGARVNFILTSRDVVHSFRVTDTTLSAMIIPGQVTKLTYTFSRPGEHAGWCQEYCGQGHHTMYFKLNVTAK